MKKYKVYMNKLPKDCWECPCFMCDVEHNCGLDDGTKDYYLDENQGGKCPLHSTKEIIEKEKEKALVLYSLLYDVLEKQGDDNVASQIEFLTKQNYSEICDLYKNIRNFRYIKHELQKECSIWKKACELACAEIPDADKFLEFNGITKQNDLYDKASKLI